MPNCNICSYHWEASVVKISVVSGSWNSFRSSGSDDKSARILNSIWEKSRKQSVKINLLLLNKNVCILTKLSQIKIQAWTAQSFLLALHKNNNNSSTAVENTSLKSYSPATDHTVPNSFIIFGCQLILLALCFYWQGLQIIHI